MTVGDRDTIDWNCQGCGRPYLTNEGLPGMSNWEVDEDGIPSAKHHCQECGIEIISPVGYSTNRSLDAETEHSEDDDDLVTDGGTAECRNCDRASETVGEGGLCLICRDAIGDAGASTGGGE